MILWILLWLEYACLAFMNVQEIEKEYKSQILDIVIKQIQGSKFRKLQLIIH